MKKIILAFVIMILCSSILFEPLATRAATKVGYQLETVDGLPAYVKDKYSVAPFSDKQIITGSYSYYAALWAKENGIISGYEDGSFKPNGPLTEAHWSKMLANYFEQFTTADPSISKQTNVIHWSNEHYDALLEHGVPLLGYFDLQTRQEKVKRGIVAQSIAQLLGANQNLETSIQYLYDKQITIGQNMNASTLIDQFGAHNYLTRMQGVTFLYRLFNADINKSAIKKVEKPKDNRFTLNPNSVVYIPPSKKLAEAISNLDSSLPDKKKGFKNFFLEKMPHTYSYETNKIGYTRVVIQGAGLKANSTYMRIWPKVDMTKYHLYLSDRDGNDYRFGSKTTSGHIAVGTIGETTRKIMIKEFNKRDQENNLRLAAKVLSLIGVEGTEEKLYKEIKNVASTGKNYEQVDLGIHYYPIQDWFEIVYNLNCWDLNEKPNKKYCY